MASTLVRVVAGGVGESVSTLPPSTSEHEIAVPEPVLALPTEREDADCWKDRPLTPSTELTEPVVIVREIGSRVGKFKLLFEFEFLDDFGESERRSVMLVIVLHWIPVTPSKNKLTRRDERDLRTVAQQCRTALGSVIRCQTSNAFVPSNTQHFQQHRRLACKMAAPWGGGERVPFRWAGGLTPTIVYRTISDKR